MMLSLFGQRTKSAPPSMVPNHSQKLSADNRLDVDMSHEADFKAENSQVALTHPPLTTQLQFESSPTVQASSAALQETDFEPDKLKNSGTLHRDQYPSEIFMAPETPYAQLSPTPSLAQTIPDSSHDTLPDNCDEKSFETEQQMPNMSFQPDLQASLYSAVSHSEDLAVSNEDVDQSIPSQEDDLATGNDVMSSTENTLHVASVKPAGEAQEPTVLKSKDDQRTCDSPNLQSYRPTRRMSAPPVSPSALSKSALREYETLLTTSRYPFAIQPNAPVKLQLLNWLQHWAITATTIENAEKRHEQNIVIGQRMEKIWLEAMRLGLVPRDWQGEDFPESLDVPTTTIEFDRRGRVVQESSKTKRMVSPNREVVIDTRSHRGSRNYGITAGELGEASTSMRAIELRMSDENLRDDGEKLLQDTLESLRQSMLTERDWRVNLERTQYNHYGRCLKTYALWEVQRSKSEIDFLNRLLPTFKGAIQIRNTETRIGTEQVLLDQLFALALELNDLEHMGSCSESELEERSVEKHTDDDAEDEGPIIVTDGDEEALRSEGPGEEASLKSPLSTPQRSPEVIFDDGSTPGPPLDSSESMEPIHHTRMRTLLPSISNEGSYSGTPQKRPLDSAGEYYDEQPFKKLRALQRVSDDIRTANVNEEQPEQENAVRDVAVWVGSDLELRKLESYLHHVVAPQVDALLRDTGRPAVPKTSTWDEMRVALKEAGISVAIRNGLVNAINKHIRSDETVAKQKDPIIDIPDIDGYPTRTEIFNTFPVDGLSFDQIQDRFDNEFMGTDKNWQSLIQSVAYYDKPRRRFYRRNELAEDLRLRKVVALNTKAMHGYKPEDFSSRIVNNTGGFRWRYLDVASPTQREAMDTVINEHVEDSKKSFLHGQAIRRKEPWRVKPYDYHEQYEVLINPKDHCRSYHHPDEFEPTPVVHGIWDRKGRKNEDKTVDGMEWFYAGEKFQPSSGSTSAADDMSRFPTGEMIKTFVARMEPTHYGGEVQVRDPEIPGMRTEDQAKGKHLPAHLRPGHGRDDVKGGTKLKLNMGSMAHESDAMHDGRGRSSTARANTVSASGSRATKAGSIYGHGGSSIYNKGGSLYTRRSTDVDKASNNNSPRTTTRSRSTAASTTKGTANASPSASVVKSKGRGRGRPKKLKQEFVGSGARTSRAKVNYAEAYSAYIGGESGEDDSDELYED